MSPNTPVPGIEPEEPWEADVGALLGGLPDVDPPPGFIAQALDHRPLYAGRTTLGLSLVAAAALTFSLSVGLAADDGVVPEVDELARQHSAVRAGLLAGVIPASIDNPVFEFVEDDTGDPPIALPTGYEPKASYEADDLKQSVYEAGDEAVSVFSQEGDVDWSKMPETGMDTIAGRPAWTDAADEVVVVVEAEGAAVTIIGLEINQVTIMLRTLPAESSDWIDAAAERFNDYTSQLGFPDLD